MSTRLILDATKRESILVFPIFVNFFLPIGAACLHRVISVAFPNHYRKQYLEPAEQKHDGYMGWRVAKSRQIVMRSDPALGSPFLESGLRRRTFCGLTSDSNYDRFRNGG
jgi:hypothetical protein